MNRSKEIVNLIESEFKGIKFSETAEDKVSCHFSKKVIHKGKEVECKIRIEYNYLIILLVDTTILLSIDAFSPNKDIIHRLYEKLPIEIYLAEHREKIINEILGN